MDTYDVIIVGAGPAGLNCAEKLSNKGLKILVLEKNKKIGQKVCAGGLIGMSFNYLKLPEKLIDCKFNEIKFHTPLNETVVKLDRYFTYIVEREKLGKWQLSKIKGVGIKTNSRVTKIEKNEVVVNNSKVYKYKYLVGADGAYSGVRRYLGLKSKKIGNGMHYLVKNKKFKELEIFLNSKLFNTGYAWIFPHKNYTSVGCCSIDKKDLMQNFRKWLNKNSIDISNAKYEAGQINFDFQGYKFGNIFLAGDAAGLASRITGEGIYEALVSGEEVAKSILDNSYNSEKMKDLVKKNNMRDIISNILVFSGPFRKIEFETIQLLLRNKWVADRLFR